jgi:hypothetical protein
VAEGLARPASIDVVTQQSPASGLVDHLTSVHRHRHAQVMQALDRHPAEVLSEDDEVGRLTKLEARFEGFSNDGKVPSMVCIRMTVVRSTRSSEPQTSPAMVFRVSACQCPITACSVSPGIGTPRYRHTSSDKIFDREHGVGAVAAIAVNTTVAEFPETRWLHGAARCAARACAGANRSGR